MTRRSAASVIPTMADDDSRRPAPGTTGAARAPATPTSPAERASSDGRDDVWGASSYLVAGPLTFGAIGFGLDRLLGTSFLAPVGIIGGIVLAVWYVWFRYGVGRDAPASRPAGPPAGEQRARSSHSHPRTHDDVRAEETT